MCCFLLKNNICYIFSKIKENLGLLDKIRSENCILCVFSCIDETNSYIIK